MYGDEVEADLAYCGIDLRDHYRPRSGPSRLTARRLLLLVDNLPDGSATIRRVLREQADAQHLKETTKGSRIKAMQARHGLTEGEDYDA